MNEKVNADNNLAVGKKFVATVKKVRAEGVYIEMPGGGSGTISPRCWGVGAERAEALGRVNPGDKLDVVVRSWDARTKTASLVLPGFEHLKPVQKVKRAMWNKCMGGQIAPKPRFTPIPIGSLIVFDLANVFGHIPVALIPAFMEAARVGLKSAGYNVVFFLEKRAMYWAWSKAASPVIAAGFANDCKAEDVTLVRGEADLPILQTLMAVGNAYAVSGDWFTDYRAAFPGIVGTDRIRKFSVANLPGGSILFSIDGVQQGVLICSPKLSVA